MTQSEKLASDQDPFAFLGGGGEMGQLIRSMDWSKTSLGPTLNGYDMARRIREQAWARDVVLVACTGWGTDDDRRRTQEAGFDFHMVKPVDPVALEQLLAGLHIGAA